MVFVLTLLKIYYIFNPNLPVLTESQEHEYVVIKIEM